MPRNRGTRRDGSNFSEFDRRAVWENAAKIPGKDPAQFRKDKCGAVISWDKYGDTTVGGMGWEIDHDRTVYIGGDHELSNLDSRCFFHKHL